MDYQWNEKKWVVLVFPGRAVAEGKRGSLCDSVGRQGLSSRILHDTAASSDDVTMEIDIRFFEVSSIQHLKKESQHQRKSPKIHHHEYFDSWSGDYRKGQLNTYVVLGDVTTTNHNVVIGSNKPVEFLEPKGLAQSCNRLDCLRFYKTVRQDKERQRESD